MERVSSPRVRASGQRPVAGRWLRDQGQGGDGRDLRVALGRAGGGRPGAGGRGLRAEGRGPPGAAWSSRVANAREPTMREPTAKAEGQGSKAEGQGRGLLWIRVRDGICAVPLGALDGAEGWGLGAGGSKAESRGPAVGLGVGSGWWSGVLGREPRAGRRRPGAKAFGLRAGGWARAEDQGRGPGARLGDGSGWRPGVMGREQKVRGGVWGCGPASGCPGQGGEGQGPTAMGWVWGAAGMGD